MDTIHASIGGNLKHIFLGCRGHHGNRRGAFGGSTYFIGPSSTRIFRDSGAAGQGVPLL